MRFLLLLAAASAALLAFEPAPFDVHEALAQRGVQLDQAQLAAEAPAADDTAAACEVACSTLAFLYKDAVASRYTPAYTNHQHAYWSLQQATAEPYCIFWPTHAFQVSTTILLSRLTRCPFAVKSGGHAAFAGASSIQGGITIDLHLLNELTLSADKSRISLGPGNTWYDVYTTLEPEGLAAVGGRVAAIGVGGLTLGGGISFFSGLYGWACDNVVNYEVVTASGLIINVNRQSYPDLYWALRGGGNNFGIVTRFDVATFPQGLMWGGGRLYSCEHRSAIIAGFMEFGANAATDTNAAVILSFAYANGSFLAEFDMQYAKPVVNPRIFENLTRIPDALKDTTQVQSLADLTLQFNHSNPSGMRETYWATAYKLDRALVDAILDVYMAEIDRIGHVDGLVPACTLQLITIPMLEHMAKNGGNPLGLAPGDGPLLLMNLNARWTREADDAAVLRANANIVARVDERARDLGAYHPYVYMNYASQFQSVIPSYGEQNARRLRDIARKYDPEGVFQTLQPGYFKLDGAKTSEWY
ncbi:uncharacterized protein K452DRAFT_310505 [Aplosporella prunicola CBS 121167]|uniref:FAD-binding PCMH-type domain-containing protein n=1 Tax=Aplosporella prunicola CBS 121167 TaxID=1176127 RepID=A0A6A6BAM0_9PEZI|nr:uncharacterized protein K452DRAFT_310505 [Aplosporella prunicola CBS 121167]KAF2139551.1 hypothetical protein K452DRAFT_310505 [Aplosporella prunicola CBS 121167]